MPKFLSALKFFQKDAVPPPPTNYDAALAHYENALATLQELVVAPVRHALEEGVVPKLRQSIPDLDSIKQRIPDSIRLPDNVLAEYVPQEVRSTIERRAEDLERLAREFVADKSHSELIFLASVLLAFVLFVVVLPAYEALFGTAKVDAEESEVEKEHVVTSFESAGEPQLGGGTKMVDVRDIPNMTFLRSASGGSNASELTMGTTGGSVGSGSMETVIEESDAKEEEVEKEEDVLAALKKNRASQKKRIEEEENARNAALAAVSNRTDRYVFEEEKKEEEPEVQELVQAREEVVHKNESIKKDRRNKKNTAQRSMSVSVLTTTNSKEESVEEKAKYNEFLSFLNSTEAVSPRSLTIHEDAPHVEDKKVGQRDYYAEPSKVSPVSREEEESVGSSASSLTASSQRSASSISRSMKKRLTKGGRKTLKKMTSSVW